VGLERGPLSITITLEELLGRNSSSIGLENLDYGVWYPSHWLALTSLKNGGRSVGIVCSRTQATELFVVVTLLTDSRNI
jgi:hypothetical protein